MIRVDARADAATLAPHATVHRFAGLAERQRIDAAMNHDRGVPRVTLTCIGAANLPLRVGRLERHPFSTQTFLPLNGQRWLALVADTDEAGEPNPQRCFARVMNGDEALTYAAGAWHMPLVALDGPAHFAVLMWRDDDGQDDIFADLPEPIEVVRIGAPA